MQRPPNDHSDTHDMYGDHDDDDDDMYGDLVDLGILTLPEDGIDHMPNPMVDERVQNTAHGEVEERGVPSTTHHVYPHQATSASVCAAPRSAKITNRLMQNRVSAQGSRDRKKRETENNVEIIQKQAVQIKQLETTVERQAKRIKHLETMKDIFHTNVVFEQEELY
jgi:hypothetical protein